jgi:Recombinase zinc beta ribbon domain
VQALLRQRNPRVTPPRVVSGPILLTGLANCATCSGAMTLRTGTSKSGKVHKYYSCSTCARHGKTVCKGRSISMDKLDGLVTTHLLYRLLTPERLTTILAALAARRADKKAALEARIKALEEQHDDQAAAYELGGKPHWIGHELESERVERHDVVQRAELSKRRGAAARQSRPARPNDLGALMSWITTATATIR